VAVSVKWMIQKWAIWYKYHHIMYQFGAFVLNMVVHGHKLGEVENECTLHNSIVLAFFERNIKNLVEVWQSYNKNNFDCFLRHGVNYCIHILCTGCANKNVSLYFCPYPCQLLTDFQFFFTGTLSRQIAIMWLLHMPPHHKNVSTLPCEI